MTNKINFCQNCGIKVDHEGDKCLACGKDLLSKEQPQVITGQGLNLVEELFVLGFRDNNKRSYFCFRELFSGAVILELILREKITLTGKKHVIKIIDESLTDDVILDHVLTMISSIGPKKLYSWIKSISRAYKYLQNELFSKLESLKIIRFLEQKRFSKPKFSVLDSSIGRNIGDKISAILMKKKMPTIRDTYLLSLLRVEYFHATFVPRNYRKAGKKRIDSIIANEPVGKAVQRYVNRRYSDNDDEL